jgi:voltage-gated potassium channel
MAFSLSKLAEALDITPSGPWAGSIRVAHEAAVIAGVAALVAATMPSLPPLWGGLCAAAIWTLAVLFAIEYVLRLAIAPWAHWAHRDEPWLARWHWATNFSGIVDLAGALPLLEIAVGVPPATAQLFGAFWLLKLVPYAPGLDLLGRVLRNARKMLLGMLIGFLMVLVLAATLEYVLEGKAQPATFGSIPSALWWAISTLTTVGYGDVVPITPLGRLLAGMVMICGIGSCALWTAILVTGFSYEMRRSEFLRTWDLVARVSYFQGLGAATIAEVAQLLRPSDFAAGTVVVRRGQPGDCMYFIVSGEIVIDLKPAPLILGPGDFFGEMALITGEPRSATASARTNCELLHLDLADFRHLEARHPEVAKLIDAEAKRRRQEPMGLREFTRS